MSTKPMTAEQQKEHDVNYNIERVLIDNAVNVVSVESAEDCGSEFFNVEIYNSSDDDSAFIPIGGLGLGFGSTATSYGDTDALKYNTDIPYFKSSKNPVFLDDIGSLVGESISGGLGMERLKAFNRFCNLRGVIIKSFKVSIKQYDVLGNGVLPIEKPEQLNERLAFVSLNLDASIKNIYHSNFGKLDRNSNTVELLKENTFAELNDRRGIFYKLLPNSGVKINLEVAKIEISQYKINK